MKHKKIILTVVAISALSAGAYGIYSLGMNQGMNMATPAASANPQGAGGTDDSGKKVLYWQDPMVPGQKFDKPGKSPFMDMELVPVYAGAEGDEGTVSISPRVQQNLGVRTAEVSQSSLSSALEAVGSVAYNERDVALVQARSNGFVERLFVRAPLDPVKKGQPLLEMYVPDWVAAQEEYLSVKGMGAGLAKGLLEGAKQRMRLAGMNDAQIRQVEASGKVQARMTLTSPVSGVISELAVREGMTVMNGAPLFRINGLNTVWVNAEIPEAMAAQVKPGNQVEARATALPGTVLKGKVSAILPEINPETRTLKARVELPNPQHQLIPGMFATINFSSAKREQVLTVPSEAVIQTGKRSVVMLAQGEGKFAPVEVEIGLEANGQTEVRKGLEAGQKVVVSGQFLIDSEASLRGTTTRMGDGVNEVGQDQGAAGNHSAKGKVESIDKNEVTISHAPITSLKWGEMTMGFKLAANTQLGNIAVGDDVNFELRATKDGTYEIVAISRAGAGKASPAVQGTKAKPQEGAGKGNMHEGMDMKGSMSMPGMPAGATK